MIIQLDKKPELESRLRAGAAEHGQSVLEYLESVVLQGSVSSSTSHVGIEELSAAANGVLGREIVLDTPQVQDFLQEHHFLSALLIEAVPHVQAHFGANTLIRLKLIRNPEFEDTQGLFAFIKTSESPSMALERLSKLDEVWWLDACPRARGLMTIDVEYI